MAGLEGAGHQEPLAPGAAQRRQPDDREAGHAEGADGEGHLPTEAVELADLVLVGHDVDGARDEEERDLADGVHQDVEARAHRGRPRREHGTEHDVRELADRRVGQSRLEAVEGQRAIDAARIVIAAIQVTRFETPPVDSRSKPNT